MLQDIEAIAERYHRFDDGLLVSFKYFYDTESDNSLTAQVVLHARNHESAAEKWDNVQITIENVEELHAKVSGNQFNSICCGVKFIKFGNSWCMDIDGNYPMAEDPKSLDEVRKYGQCYIIGQKIKIVCLPSA